MSGLSPYQHLKDGASPPQGTPNNTRLYELRTGANHIHDFDQFWFSSLAIPYRSAKGQRSKSISGADNGCFRSPASMHLLSATIYRRPQAEHATSPLPCKRTPQ
jgi:hypothetical protein